MKKKILSFSAILMLLFCLIILTVMPAHAAQGTKGDELQLMEPELLEIRLGKNFAYSEFKLETDAGMYPGTVKASEDGILQMDVGGSSKYILTLLPRVIGDAVSTEPIDVPDESSAVTENIPEETLLPVTDSSGNTVAGIPVLHIALFGGGMFLCITVLIILSVRKHKRTEGKSADDDLL